DRKQAREELDNSGFRTEALEHRGKLYANGSSSQDDQRLWNLLELEYFVARYDLPSIDLQAWKRARHGAGSNDRVASVHNQGGSILAADGDRPGFFDVRRPFEDLDLFLLHQEADPLEGLQNGFVFVLLPLIEVD